MEEVLTSDATLTLPDFTLVSASAGSGKTTALTRRFLQILLSDRIPHNTLPHILAVTFTNNAAAEMKERIIEYLKRIAFGDESVLERFRTIVSVDDEHLVRRARNLVDVILENYSDFHVETIDSFLSRILRVSALQFGFTPGFEIVLNGTELVEEAFDLLMASGGKDPAGRELLRELLELLSDTRRDKDKFLWNPSKDLLREVRQVYQRVGSKREDIGPLPEGTASDAGKKKIAETLLAISGIAERGNFTITVNFQKIISLVQKGEFSEILTRKLGQNVLKASKSAGFQDAVAQIERLQRKLEDAARLYCEERARTYYRPYVKTLRHVMELLGEVRRRKGQISLQDAVKALANAISEGDVPEIYFSLGESIHHYLVDEFQDTSPIQWATLRPLAENSLSQKGSLFLVGDMKQAIYTFRGGDWQIMKKMMSAEEFSSVRCTRKELTTNYRSAEPIVRFGGKVFREIVPQKVSGALADLSGLASFKQDVDKSGKGKGYAEVSTFQRDEDADPADPPEKQKLLAIVRDCCSRGFGFRDLAVLTPRNKDVVEVSRWLNESNIPFLSQSSLDIRTRKITGELLAVLKFLDSPVDNLAFATVLLGGLFGDVSGEAGQGEEIQRFLFESRLEAAVDEPLYVRFRSAFPELWDQVFEPLLKYVGYLPLYDLFTQIYSQFRVFTHHSGEMSAFARMLEIVRSFEQDGGNNLKEFLRFAEDPSDEDEWNLDAPKDANAVRVTTVHKAKGLGFPVVIVLLFDGPPRSNNLFYDRDEEGIRLLRIVKDWANRSDMLAGIYQKDHDFRKVDELNKLYVALTRAREEMYVLSVVSSRFPEPSAYLPPGKFTDGIRMRRNPNQEDLPSKADLHFLEVPTAIQQVAEASLRFAETQRGNFYHDVLSRIVFLDRDMETQLQKAVAISQKSGRVSGDSEPAVATLSKFLRHPEIRPFFEQRGERSVLNEREIVSSRGRLFRVDRLVVDPDAVTIIDFKTGDEQPEYVVQVRGYMEIAREIFRGRSVRGVLAYIDRHIVRFVE
ncbi:MAG TPA: UvrD-helicase domain-containing protein [Bacteroidota bacterium]|nr:UvrD-helicase domain-containing protein [Bacteroidota bacterium]